MVNVRSGGTPLPYLVWYFVFLIAAWIGAWYLHDVTPIGDVSSGALVGYWTAAKLLIWIAPILSIVRFALKQPVMVYLGLTRFVSGARVGLLIGVTFVAVSAIVDVVARSHTFPAPSWALLSTVTVAPLFEEVMFRGFAMKVLEDSGYGFWPSNAIAALLFLGLHLPGWYFTGAFAPSQAIVGLSIVLIGMVAGYARHRSNSTWASVIVHFLNNLYSAFVR